jgi:hypothetical protein
MDRVLHGLKWTECLCYMDDILVFEATFEENQSRLNNVLTALGNAGFVLNAKKCVFGAKEIAHLGHLVDNSGIRSDPAKTVAIVNFPRPMNVTQLRAFLGMASFYRSFTPGFAETAKPLHVLLNKKADVIRDWSVIHDNAMQELKHKLVSAPVLVCDDGISQLELQTDASVKGIGAVLLLKKNGESHPITFISRKLSDAEQNYHANELKCLALVWALGKLRYYVYGRPVLVKTDSSALSWLFKKKDLNGKFARWILTLQEYSIDIQHIRGTANVVADALSRAPVDSEVKS